MQVVELYPGVVADPQILGGKPVRKGTRLPVSLVLGETGQWDEHRSTTPWLKLGACACGAKCRGAFRESHMPPFPYPVRIGRPVDCLNGAVRPVSVP
jgi:hypothetical protein